MAPHPQLDADDRVGDEHEEEQAAKWGDATVETSRDTGEAWRMEETGQGPLHRLHCETLGNNTVFKSYSCGPGPCGKGGGTLGGGHDHRSSEDPKYKNGKWK